MALITIAASAQKMDLPEACCVPAEEQAATEQVLFASISLLTQRKLKGKFYHERMSHISNRDGDRSFIMY